ncbi:50S ribosomal protein L9 [Xanthobacter autotrophicus]|jgi:large subunit ribosomal protein L9|uniref:Large ribosomal subunit protein bL9 n=1 Tax=Xanthobacter autotrophicus TaxID=280 RepID=A0A6C1KDU3_XANAU|nr:50S ribosomal protein L9 [Xanthobacter autotrophicus]TLX42429.1 50S ribosomal protein L9 [Xanthobacter autotrophicus]
MDVILLERVAKLGQMGEVVKVRDGYARNFLLPNGKALRATKANKTRFDTMKIELEARNLERRKDAEAVAEKLNGQSVAMIRQAGESGQLYGSVSTRDIADGLTAAGFTVDRQQVILNHPIKTLGVHVVPVTLHPEVEVTVKVNVARNAEEAERQARGEDVRTARDEDAEIEAELAIERAEVAAELAAEEGTED